MKKINKKCDGKSILSAYLKSGILRKLNKKIHTMDIDFIYKKNYIDFKIYNPDDYTITIFHKKITHDIIINFKNWEPLLDEIVEQIKD